MGIAATGEGQKGVQMGQTSSFQLNDPFLVEKKQYVFPFFPLWHCSIADPKEKLLEDEVHAFNALLDEEKFDREQQLMSPSA